MDLELSEVFVCPDCRPAQGLVVLVDRMEGRRVLAGSLGCPECGLRAPVRDGMVRFEEGSGPGPGGGDGSEGAASLRQRLGGDPATVAAALLGVGDLEGPFLLGPGLAALATAVAELAGAAEILALEGASTEERTGSAESVTRLRGVSPGHLPLFSGRLGGVVLLAPDADAVQEGIRVLRAGGRLVVLLPPDDSILHLPDGSGEVVASDERAWVAVRAG